MLTIARQRSKGLKRWWYLERLSSSCSVLEGSQSSALPVYTSHHLYDKSMVLVSSSFVFELCSSIGKLTTSIRFYSSSIEAPYPLYSSDSIVCDLSITSRALSRRVVYHTYMLRFGSDNSTSGGEVVTFWNDYCRRAGTLYSRASSCQCIIIDVHFHLKRFELDWQ